jgi:cobalt-zinc-cadmium efflux system membrane fusion protein
MVTIACEKENKTEVAETVETNSNVVKVSKSQFEHNEMTLTKMSTMTFKDEISVNGTIDLPPEQKAHVSPVFNGYVENIKLLEGQSVKKGELLFTLFNPDYLRIQDEFLQVKFELEYLKSDYERLKRLSGDSISSIKSFQKTKSEFESKSAVYESKKKQILLMGINPEKLDKDNLVSKINVKSPITGRVSEVNISKGEFIESNRVAVKILGIDHLHVELKIYEKDFQKIKKGQKISFKINNNPALFEAEVFLIGNHVDPVNRYVNVHAHLIDDDTKHILIPGMYVNATVALSERTVSSLPIESVMEIDGKYFALKLKSQSDNFEFEKVEIKKGAQKNDFIEVLNSESILDTDQFLLSGAYSLISE